MEKERHRTIELFFLILPLSGLDNGGQVRRLFERLGISYEEKAFYDILVKYAMTTGLYMKTKNVSFSPRK
jgi:hypothetical protein